MSDIKAEAKAIFLEALECTGADERTRFLEQACAGNRVLRTRVEELLRAHRDSGAFLGGQQGTRRDEPMAECPGTVIGHYKLMERIGEGGMGLVFVAEQQQPVRRKVAIKVIKPGMDTREVIARFEAERQALALMDHANIARVLDAGATESGRPYFVMELVRGVDLIQFCDKNRLPPRARLELFVHVCRAVQHAHLKGIIHRDLKPTNILVTLHDGTPVIKVIDFGVAKAIGQRLTERTIYTRYAQMIGTPMYMSPEQAEMSGLDIDTRSDIYALGVLLYELLTGTTPFDNERLRTAAFDEMRRIIREEEPGRPSTRFSTAGHSSDTVCANRRSDPKRLSQLLCGELDWIVMKALEKDRNRRYETASAFAADVQRYLNDEPVQACPPAFGYRVRKFVRRHRGAVLSMSLVVLALVFGIIGTTWGMLRATDAEAEALGEAAQKETALREKEAALQAAQASARATQEQLMLALRNQARAERVSGRPGQRFATLKAIGQASKIRVTPELRTEAIAALILPDVEVAQEWNGYPEGTIAAAFDAEFQRFARISRAGAVTICRLTDNGEEVIAQLPAHGKAPFHRLWLSPDGRFVAYGYSRVGQDEARGICVWNLDGPKPALLLDEQEGVHGNALAFRPNGRQLAIGHYDKSVSVYDLATGERVQRLANTVTAVHLAFHPRDGRLALACRNAGVQLFDVETGAELPALRHPAGVSWTYSIAWHPDGRRIAAGCNDRKIHIWDTETGTETMLPWVGTGGDGSVVAFNHVGDRLGSVDWTGLSYVWDTATGRLLLTAQGVNWQFSASDRLHGYSFEGTKVKVWRLAAGRELRVLRRRNADALERIGSPIVHTDGHVLAASSESGGYRGLSWLCFFDVATGEELAAVKLALDRPFCFHRAGGWLTGGMTGLLEWPAKSEVARPEVLCVGPPKTLRAGLGSRFAIGAGASADGGILAVPDGSSITLLRREHPEQGLKLGPQYDLRFVAVSPDGRWVATCSHFTDGRSKSTRIWDADTGRQVHELPLEGSTGATFTPNGRWLATYNAGRTQLWEVGTWQPVRLFEGGALFSPDPDSCLMAFSGPFGVIRLVDTHTGREVARLTAPEVAGYTPLCFTPDGTRLIAANSDEKTLHVWNLRAIRAQLKPMGLDWDWPEFRPVDPKTQKAAMAKVEILGGAVTQTILTREEKAQQSIARYSHEVKKDPDNARACNNLAWAYVTAPAPLRDVKAALPLAENAVRLAADNVSYRNTLGVVYYRAARYRDAVEILRPNLVKQDDKDLASDLFFLAMSHHQLGEFARARDYYDWALRWRRTQSGLSAELLEELSAFQAEAEDLMKEMPDAQSTK